MAFLDNTGLERLWTHICAKLGTKADAELYTTSGNGSVYTVTANNITSLTTGLRLIIVPHTNSTTTSPSLNVNGLGIKTIRRPVSNSLSTTAALGAAGWLEANKPVEIMYNGTYWVVMNMIRPEASDINGTISVANGGTGATNAGKTLLSNIGITSGTGNPPSSGNSGTIYIQYSE